MQPRSDRLYGPLILALIVGVGLYMAYDAQASIMHPGWFSGWRSGVWCKTVIYGPAFGTGTFYHYPGKRLSRVMRELQVPPAVQTMYADAQSRETRCFASWEEAAKDHVTFQGLATQHPAVVTRWEEEQYRQAVILMNLRREGAQTLARVMAVEQERLEEQH